MMAIDFQALAQVSAARVLNTLAEGLALAGLSWAGLRFLGSRSAVVRFAVWFSTLLAVISLPFIGATGSAGAWHKPELQLSGSWATYLFVLWAVIAILLLLRLAGSLWHVRRLRRQCPEIDPRFHPELVDILRQYQGGRQTRLLVSEDVRVPTALGFFRPSIVLPAWAIDELSGDELKVILLHELAHLRRWDDWTNLAQKLLKAVFFFHPAVWWIESRLALEREMACDDMVLEHTENPKSYAASLVTVAEKAFAEKVRVRRALALAQTALGRMRQTSARIAQILDAGRSRDQRKWRPAVAMVGGLVLVAFVAMPYAPQVISFRGQKELSGAPRMSSAPVLQSALVQAEPVKFSVVKASLTVPAREVAPKVIPARVKMRKANKPKVVLAKAKVNPEPSFNRAPTQMLVFFQSTDVDASGSAVWTLCVWHLGTDGSGKQVEETIVMNSI